MTSSTETNFDKLSNDDLMRLYLEGIQVYEDQIEIMDYVRKKSIEVRKKRKIIIDQKPNIPILPRETAQGKRKATSRSKIINRIATR